MLATSLQFNTAQRLGIYQILSCYLLSKRLGEMGGCCSSSRKLQLHGAPVYYYYPPSPEDHAFLTSQDSGILLDLNLNMSVPDTHRPPPAPIIPYDIVLGRPQSTYLGSREVTLSGKLSSTDFEGANYTTQMRIPQSPKKSDIELLKSNPLTVAATDNKEDVCPTCFEEYDSENPKIVTKCNHHFHLSCILEWMERSNMCPICDQEMIYENPISVPSCMYSSSL